jgi:hypothetical protein
MTSMSGAHLPANSGPQTLRNREPAPGLASQEESVSTLPPKGKISPLSAGGSQAHAVVSYGHTAQLHHGGRLATLLDVHV